MLTWPLGPLWRRLCARCIGDCVVPLYHAVFGDTLSVVGNNRAINVLAMNLVQNHPFTYTHVQ
jgi:hypothetical protein